MVLHPKAGCLIFQAGDLFRLDSTGNLSVLHSFTQTDATAGIVPNSRLVQGADGALYGTTAISTAALRGDAGFSFSTGADVR